MNGFCCLDNRAMEFDYHKIRILNYMKLCKKDQIMMKINGRTLVPTYPLSFIYHQENLMPNIATEADTKHQKDVFTI